MTASLSILAVNAGHLVFIMLTLAFFNELCICLIYGLFMAPVSWHKLFGKNLKMTKKITFSLRHMFWASCFVLFSLPWVNVKCPMSCVCFSGMLKIDLFLLCHNIKWPYMDLKTPREYVLWENLTRCFGAQTRNSFFFWEITFVSVVVSWA